MKGIFVTVYSHRPRTSSFSSLDAMKQFLSTVTHEAAVRDHTGRLRLRWLPAESDPSIFVLRAAGVD